MAKELLPIVEMGLILILMLLISTRVSSQNVTVAPSVVIPVCRDHHYQSRNPGDEWLVNSKIKCSCSQSNFVSCLRLKEPACMDITRVIRNNQDTWMKSACIKCVCENGSVNCTRFEVNITYGLYEVESYGICEHCVYPVTRESSVACKAFLGTAARYHRTPKMFRCFSGRHFIWDKHRCNGIQECPDGSDEIGCEDKKCTDEKGNTYLIGDSNVGWRVSPCLRCDCVGGLLACKRTSEVNFPGHYHGYYSYEENCTQPSCKVSQFIRDNKDKCQGVEILQNKGILVKGQTWNTSGCEFYFHGPNNKKGAATCPPMARPVCYVYNGAVCCASHCPALRNISKQMRGNLTVCANGRQLVSPDLQCPASNCHRDFSMQNCTAELTCQDEEFNKYFEGTKWSVGACIQCSCNNGKIKCTRKLLVINSFGRTITEHCNQTGCQVARYIKRNQGLCKACRWNRKIYYIGDGWKENGIDFYCVEEKVRPGCYVERHGAVATCTGAIAGLRNVSLISQDQLFLCDSGDELISAKDRCDIKTDCYDLSDENNCPDFCKSEMKFGLLWPKTGKDQEITVECSSADSNLTGTFSSKCEARMGDGVVWIKHNCGCEKKSVMEYFKKKIQGVNKTNFMSVSREFINSYERFKNKKVLQDMLNDLFDAVKATISPITVNNVALALEFSELVIGLVTNKYAYYVGDLDKEAFCKQTVSAQQRKDLGNKVLDFLRTAPQMTEAYSYSMRPLPSIEEVCTTSCIQISTFGRPLRPQRWISITRKKLILHLIKAQLVPPRSVKDTPVHVHHHIKLKPTANITSNSTWSGNVTTANKTNDLSNEEIKAILAANNCSRVTYDEEKGTFKIYRPTVTSKHQNIQHNLELVLLCVSVAGVILSLLLLTIVRVKNSERIFVHKSLLSSIGLANLVFILDVTLFHSRKDHVAVCSFVAVIKHYLNTAVFTWMLVEGINLYFKLVKVFAVNKQYLTYLAVGWGIPAIIIGLVAAIRPFTYDMGEVLHGHVTCGPLEVSDEIERTRCWINGSRWVYKGPVVAILVVNVVLFVIILRVVFGKIASKYGKNNIEAVRRGARSIVALLPLLGVTWLLGFFVDFHDAVKYAFILVNSIMGVVFCIFHCVLDDQVREALRAYKICIKQQTDQKVGTTPATSALTPFMDKNRRMNKCTYPENGEGKVDLICVTSAQQDESSL